MMFTSTNIPCFFAKGSRNQDITIEVHGSIVFVQDIENFNNSSFEKQTGFFLSE